MKNGFTKSTLFWITTPMARPLFKKRDFVKPFFEQRLRKITILKNSTNGEAVLEGSRPENTQINKAHYTNNNQSYVCSEGNRRDFSQNRIVLFGSDFILLIERQWWLTSMSHLQKEKRITFSKPSLDNDSPVTSLLFLRSLMTSLTLNMASLIPTMSNISFTFDKGILFWPGNIYKKECKLNFMAVFQAESKWVSMLHFQIGNYVCVSVKVTHLLPGMFHLLLKHWI